MTKIVACNKAYIITLECITVHGIKKENFKTIIKLTVGER
jgi:hypothetical protein